MLHTTLHQLSLFAKQILCGWQRQVLLDILLKVLQSSHAHWLALLHVSAFNTNRNFSCLATTIIIISSAINTHYLHVYPAEQEENEVAQSESYLGHA